MSTESRTVQFGNALAARVWRQKLRQFFTQDMAKTIRFGEAYAAKFVND